MSVVDGKRSLAEAEERRARGRTNEGRETPSRFSYSDAPEVVVSDSHNTGFFPEVPELGAEEETLPAYSEFHDQISVHQAGFDAGAAVTDDGRVNISINQTSRQLADIIAPTLRNQLKEEARYAAEHTLPPAYIPPSLGGQPGQIPPPRLNVVIQIVGSRGDVQPFIALGLILKNTYGHRIRIATHSTFQKFVEENGLEFFNIGGDPAELMAFMVKNPGLMPGMDALKSGEITKRRKGIEQIILGCWRSCIEAGNGLGPAPRHGRRDKENDPNATQPPLPLEQKPFVADAIIANPPSFAHIHVAEKLGVPLHLMFTMPWSPTRAFPQPLANIQSSNTDPVTTNYLSYTLVEMMTWQGLGDVINRFRTKVLDLEPLSLVWAPAVLTRLRIPYTYCWSPALIPKPNDWGQHIDIAGFYFLNLASSYTPDPELAAFLEAGPPPVYIGFGSIVVDDPNALTRMIFDAVAETGVRALVSKGWGGLGADSVGIPEGVFMLGNVPHDWLFQHVSAVCHHGGAGTTAAGIQAGKPTIVVPFFGDQPFWGAMVARAGAGPDPIPYAKLTGPGLAEAIKFAIKPETLERAHELGEKIREEKGADVGGQCFHKHLNVDSLRCALAPSRVAAWRVRRTRTHISAFAATTLVNNGYLQYSDLKLFRSKEYSTEDHPTDPITACTSALVGDLSTMAMAVADFPRDIFKAARGTPKSKPKPDDKIEGGTSAAVSASDVSSTKPATASADPSTAGPNSDAASILSNPLGSLPSAQSSMQNITPVTSVTSGPPVGQTEASAPPAVKPTDSNQQRGDVNENLDRALGAGKSLNNIVAAGVKTPMNFCLGLARGFRNAPSLYNDDTVRPTEKVTGIGSGLRIAGKEFGLGLYDGVTGLVTQPLRGAEKEGSVGLLKGFGKGIGGLIFKPTAGFWGIPGYAMAGVHAEIRTMFAESAQNYIVASRVSQGNADFQEASIEEREDIEARWLNQKETMKGFYALKQKQKGKSRDNSPSSKAPAHAAVTTEQVPTEGEPPRTGWFNTRHLSFEERKKLQDRKKALKKQYAENRAAGPFIDENVAANSSSDNLPSRHDDEFEQAIQAAVQETSRGDAAEDARIEQAIRSSVNVFRTRSTTMSSIGSITSNYSTFSDYLPDIKRPLPEDPRDSQMGPPVPPRTLNDLDNITDEQYQALIEQAVQMSLAEDPHSHSGIRMHDREKDSEESSEDEDLKRALERSETERGRAEPEDDEEYRRALEASQKEQGGRGVDEEEELRKALEASQQQQQQQQGVHGPNDDDEEELRRVMEESERAHQEELARADSLKTEEEMVLEYVKKQSLAEEEYRRKKSGAGGGGADDDEDEELRRVLEESMQGDDGHKRGGGGGPSRFS